MVKQERMAKRLVDFVMALLVACVPAVSLGLPQMAGLI